MFIYLTLKNKTLIIFKVVDLEYKYNILVIIKSET